MKHLSKRIAALALALAMTLTLTSWASAADYADMPDNWAKAPMEAAVEAGLLQGNNGRLDPTGPLTRAQMAAILVRAFGATQSADVSKFTDVKANAWYVTQNAVPGAVFMQIMNGNDNGTFEPDKAITREAAFAILARALKLEAGVAEDLNKFKDGDKVSSWFVGEIAAMTKAGYVNGNDGMLNPKNNISRQEFAQVMYNIFGVYINEAGTYTEMGEKTVMISAHDANIENATIKGDVIIGEGVGEGDVFFKNTTIEGRVVVRGGGVNSIHFINSSTNDVLVAKIEGPVRIVMDEASEVSTVAVVAGKDAVTVEGNVRAIEAVSDTPVTVKNGTVATIKVDTTAEVTLDKATVGTMEVNVAEANVALTNESTVHTLEVAAEAAGATVTGDANTQIGIINSDADITLDGDVVVTEINGDGLVSDPNGDPVIPNPDVPLPEDVEDAFCTHDWQPDPTWKDGEALTDEQIEAGTKGNGIVVAATCGVAGRKTLICSKCGEIKSENIPATGKHVYGHTKDKKDITDPSKLDADSTDVNCVRVDENMHYVACINDGCLNVAGAKHTLTKTEGEGEDAKTVNIACLCGYERALVDEKTLPENLPEDHVHNWVECEYAENAEAEGAGETLSVKPTCGADGVLLEKCDVKYTPEGGDETTCTAVRKTTLPATGKHQWATTEDYADAAEEAERYKTDADGWFIGEAGDCVTRVMYVRQCKNCDAVEFKYGDVNVTAHKTAEGTDPIAFGAVDYDCFTAGFKAGTKCPFCLNVLTQPEAAGGSHTWEGDEGAETCSVCSRTKKNCETGHTFEKNTPAGVCDKCTFTCDHKKDGKDAGVWTYEEVKGDSSNPDKVTGYKHTKTCSICQKELVSKSPCRFSDVPGTYLAPSCSEAGHQANKKCSICGKVWDGEEIAATGKHNFDSETGKCTNLKQDGKTVCDFACTHQDAEQQDTFGYLHDVDKDGKQTHQKYCTTCGLILDEEPVLCGSWTAEGKCGTCGAEHNHDAKLKAVKDNATDAAHNLICDTCKKVVDTEAHTWGDKNGKCTVCEYECTHKDGSSTYVQNASEAKHTETHTCCGKEEAEAGCVYDQANNTKCVCGREKPAASNPDDGG